MSFICVLCFFFLPERQNVTASGRSNQKKPLNAFMIFCREQRPSLLAKNMRNHAAINKHLGEMVSV